MRAQTTWTRLCPASLDDPVVASVERAFADPDVCAELRACEAHETYPSDVLAQLREPGVPSRFAEAGGEPSRGIARRASSRSRRAASPPPPNRASASSGGSAPTRALVDRTGEARPAAMDEAERELARVAEGSRTPLLEEGRHG